jgi:hypothetical protein
MESPEKLVCASCGAALPAEKTSEGVIWCAHCGTPYRPPSGQAGGGIHFSAGSTVIIRGDMVAGDKVVYQPPRSLWQRLLAALRPKR